MSAIAEVNDRQAAMTERNARFKVNMSAPAIRTPMCQTVSEAINFTWIDRDSRPLPNPIDTAHEGGPSKGLIQSAILPIA